MKKLEIRYTIPFKFFEQLFKNLKKYITKHNYYFDKCLNFKC